MPIQSGQAKVPGQLPTVPAGDCEDKTYVYKELPQQDLDAYFVSRPITVGEGSNAGGSAPGGKPPKKGK